MKVLIVDDEYLIRTHILCSIPWEELGMRVVGEARDLESAVEAVEQLEPDIVLTDIRMPGIAGGIGLVQYLHRNAPHIYTVIISGHSDFSYAQDAIAALRQYLKKSVRLCQWDGEGKLAEAGRYMNARNLGIRLDQWTQGTELKKLGIFEKALDKRGKNW